MACGPRSTNANGRWTTRSRGAATTRGRVILPRLVTNVASRSRSRGGGPPLELEPKAIHLRSTQPTRANARGTTTCENGPFHTPHDGRERFSAQRMRTEAKTTWLARDLCTRAPLRPRAAARRSKPRAAGASLTETQRVCCRDARVTERRFTFKIDKPLGKELKVKVRRLRHFTTSSRIDAPLRRSTTRTWAAMMCSASSSMTCAN